MGYQWIQNRTQSFSKVFVINLLGQQLLNCTPTVLKTAAWVEQNPWFTLGRVQKTVNQAAIYPQNFDIVVLAQK